MTNKLEFMDNLYKELTELSSTQESFIANKDRIVELNAKLSDLRKLIRDSINK